VTTYHILLALHLVFAVFGIGPLVAAATTAARGVRTGDAAATASSARMIRIYSYPSLLVVILGFALLSVKVSFGGGPKQKLGEFSDTWVWLSLVLWVVAIALALGVLAPTLVKAGTAMSGARGSASALVGRVAASGGVVGILFVVIICLMVWRPGS